MLGGPGPLIGVQVRLEVLAINGSVQLLGPPTLRLLVELLGKGESRLDVAWRQLSLLAQLAEVNVLCV